MARRVAAISATAMAGLLSTFSQPAIAQEIEIDRWNQLPIDQNFGVAYYAHTSGDITFDPVLQIEDAKVDMDTWLLGYIRTFELLDRTARIEVRQAWKDGTWKGLVAGAPATVHRQGLDDTFVRFVVNIIGGPPLSGPAYAEYRAHAETETIVGMALGVQFPTGQYLQDKLINLGGNRFVFRPQLGLRHKHFAWTFEATGTAFIFSDNTSFFGGNRLSQDPLFAVDGSVKYNFPSGLWASVGAGIGAGGQSSVNGVRKNDRRQDVGWLVSAGFPITRWLSVKATFVGVENLNRVGTASRTVSLGITGTW